MTQAKADEPTTPRPRIVPLSLKLGSATLLILGVASVLVAGELARRERTSLVESKRRATEQVVDLFATYDAAALAFADVDATTEDVRGLAQNRDVTYAAVWTIDGEEPVASYGRHAERPRRPAVRAATTVRRDSLDVRRPIVSAEGDPLGVALVRVSLAPENRAYEASLTRIRTAVVVSAIALAALLAFALYRLVTNPLAELVEATGRVERGERSDVEARSNDEVGELAKAFSRMAHTIADREASLRATTDRLQKVLDHMGQAILVFDASGTIDTERSREASAIVGPTERSIVDVLFPEASGLVEREAFEAWTSAVIGDSTDRFESVADLAPTEARIRVGDSDHTYRLDFRPVVNEGIVDRVMLLATDVTEERALRADAMRKDEEHEKRVAAMRRLVAGGGQVFVRFLEGARYRITHSREHLREITRADRRAVADVFRHVHTLRGEARCFDLDVIESRLARVEFDLADLRTRHDERYDIDAAKASIDAELAHSAKDLDEAESLFVEQSPVGAAILDQVTVRRSDIAALEELAGSRVDAVAAIATRLASRPFGESVFLVAESVARWIARESKSAELAVEGRDLPVPPGLAKVLPGVLAHLVRNAIAHGVELPEVRLEAGKDERATITLLAEPHGDSVRIAVRDDGKGFDVEAMRAKARDAGIDDSGGVQALAGRVGSTRADADELAGHGVGLDAVRVELEEAGYHLRVESEPGKGSTMWIERAAPVAPATSRNPGLSPTTRTDDTGTSNPKKRPS